MWFLCALCGSKIKNKRMQQKSTFKKINIDKPCTENWNEMQSQGANKFCQQCSTIIIDFSKMSDKEVIDFLEQRKYQQTCGKFEAKRLEKLNNQLSLNRSKRSLIKPILTAAILTTATLSATAQEYNKPVSTYKIIQHQINSDSANTVVIRGKLVDLQGEPLIAATVSINETGTITDIDGSFKLRFNTNEYDDLKVRASYIGCETLEIPLNNVKNKEIEIILKESEEIIIGEIVTSRQPLHKRIWYKITRIFRK
jgi:hypothetical protein